MHTQTSGYIAENKALDFLQKKGLKFIEANFRCAMGEIDIIMRDKEYIVFVEVRKRKTTDFGGGILSVTQSKMSKIINTSMYYLMKKKLEDKHPIRFDIVSIDGKSEKITWIKAAFDADY